MRLEKESIKPYSLMAMVGPSGVGKSYWVDKVRSIYPSLMVISSDRERYELLGVREEDVDNTYRYSPEMKEVSESAFHILKAKVEGACMYGHQHILIDSTGSKDTLQLLASIADKYGYKRVAIVIDFSRKELERYSPDKKIFLQSLKNFNENSLRSLSGWTRLDLRERDIYPTLISESPIYLPTFSVIGDIHQDVDKVNRLIPQLKGREVYLGDYFDLKEGVNTKESIDKTLLFLEGKRQEGQVLLKGNHENYIRYRLNGGTKCDVEDEYFNSIPFFFEYEDLRERFISIYGYLMDYAYIISNGYRYKVSHTPVSRPYRCKPGYKQNYKFTVHRDKDLREQLLPILDDKEPVTTINGHVTHNGDTLKLCRNRYLIDTSPAITALICEGNSISSRKVGEYNKSLYSLLPSKEVDDITLSKIDNILNNGGRFISGTMSPPPSLNGKLECIESALSLFKAKGITQLLLDTKHMGSRCTCILNEDNSYSLYSRSGLPIKHIQIPITSLIEIKERLGLDSIIFDGELMPWSVLGEGLVQEYEAKLWVYKQLNTLNIHTSGIEETDDVLNNFNERNDPYYIPFSILEMNKGGNKIYPEWDMNTLEIKELLQTSSDLYKVIEVNQVDETLLFFNEVVNKGLEGLVIKPLLAEDKAKIPYIKVRGKDYLRLVYGPDYVDYEKSLADKRNIKNKLSLSLTQWKLGEALIKSNSRDRQKSILIDFLGSISQEQSLDPRL